jgi:hypothetical protein
VTEPADRPTDRTLDPDAPRARLAEELRAPRSAAVAGIVFALILGTVIVLFRSAGPAASGGDESWLTDAGRRSAVTLAMNLVPFAGIAFLWFIGVLRARLGAREDKLFATVFLGSGLLFVAMLFVGAGLLGAVLALEARGGPLTDDTVALAQFATAAVIGTFGARMAAVFTLSATTAALRTRSVPRWIAMVGYVVALALLVSPPLPGWAQLLFPGWVLLVSVYILVSAGPGPAPSSAPPTPTER